MNIIHVLHILQLVCCVVTAMLAVILAIPHMQMRWINRRYEQSRWMLCLAMLGYSVHYLIQMTCGLRASGDDVGAVVNILAYTPMAFIISLAILNIEISTSGLRRYILQSVITYALIIIAFIVGYSISGSLHIGYMLYVMLALFVVSMACFIRKMRKATNRHRRQTEKTSGADNMPYIRYSQAAITLLYVAGAILPITILSTTLLYIFGPFMLLSLVFFIQTFVALGYYYNPSEANTGRETPPPLLRKIPEERVRFIQKALDRWCLAGGYKDKSATMMSLAKQTTVSKEELSEYFSIYMNSSFRIWLSDMRFYRMQQMMIDFPQYSNDAISAECGFSSHAHLYKIFKVKTGMTPKQWKDTAIPVIPE